MKNKFLSIVTLSLLAFLLLNCNGENTEATPEKVVTDKNEALVVPVETMIISKQPVAQSVTYTGIISANNSVDIIAEVSGKIEKINSKLGDRVTPNQTLAVIDYRIPEANFKQAEAQVLSMENNLSIAKTNFESDKVLYSNGDISKLTLDNSKLAVKTAEANLMSAKAQLKIAKKTFDDTKLSSPISGFVSRKNIELGTMVNIGTPVYRVVDLSNMKIKLGVPQDIVGRISNRTAANIRISSLDGLVQPGQVKYVSPQADEQTGTFEVEIHFNNTPSNSIKAGMTSKVELILSEKEQKLVVPDYAIAARNGDAYIYLMQGDKAKLTKVKIGESYGAQIEILDGVNEGAEIVVVGMKNLGVDTKVKIEKKHN